MSAGSLSTKNSKSKNSDDNNDNKYEEILASSLSSSPSSDHSLSYVVLSTGVSKSYMLCLIVR
jgi:hypothetical protein